MLLCFDPFLDAVDFLFLVFSAFLMMKKADFLACRLPDAYLIPPGDFALGWVDGTARAFVGSLPSLSRVSLHPPP